MTKVLRNSLCMSVRPFDNNNGHFALNTSMCVCLAAITSETSPLNCIHRGKQVVEIRFRKITILAQSRRFFFFYLLPPLYDLLSSLYVSMTLMCEPAYSVSHILTSLFTGTLSQVAISRLIHKLFLSVFYVRPNGLRGDAVG